MRATVLGVGAAGEVVARHLANSGSFDELVITDADRGRLQAVADKVSDSVEARRIDVRRREDLAKACRGADLVLNCVSGEHNLRIMREALRQKAHYIDLAAEPVPARGGSEINLQLEMDDAFRRRDRIALLGMGVAPGVTNLLVRWASTRFTSIDTVRIRVYGSGYAQVEGHPFAPLFSAESFLDEVLSPAVVWNVDRLVWLPPFEGEEIFVFPDPLGPATCYNVSNDETETLPRLIGKGIRFIDFKYAIAPDRKAILESLYRLGLSSKKPVRIGRAKVRPVDMVLALVPPAADLPGRVRGATCVTVEVEGRGAEGVRLWTIMDHRDAYKRMGVTGTGFLTGTPPAAAAEAIVEGEIRERGVVTGGGIDPTPVLERCASRGMPLLEGPIGSTEGISIVV